MLRTCPRVIYPPMLPSPPPDLCCCCHGWCISVAVKPALPTAATAASTACCLSAPSLKSIVAEPLTKDTDTCEAPDTRERAPSTPRLHPSQRMPPVAVASSAKETGNNSRVPGSSEHGAGAHQRQLQQSQRHRQRAIGGVPLHVALIVARQPSRAGDGRQCECAIVSCISISL